MEIYQGILIQATWSMVYKGEWVHAPDLWTSFLMESNVIKEKQGVACYSTKPKAEISIDQL